ncbi:hypothetical protein BH09MYX1_BH09MYX1_09310 [soil metagenome]
MRRTALPLVLFGAIFAVSSAFAQAPTGSGTGTGTGSSAGAGSGAGAGAGASTGTGNSTTEPSDRAAGMKAYEDALAARKLGSTLAMKSTDVDERVAEAEELLRVGRVDEAIARLVEMVESPTFKPFENDENGRAATYTLGDALATAGAYEPARGYLRRLLTSKNAWEGFATYARRAGKRLVDVALESERFDAGLEDVKLVPTTAPDETRGEVDYVTGRALESKDDFDGAIAAYQRVTQRSRFWAQATYLTGLIYVEKGKLKEGEDMFCRVADPKKTQSTTPSFGDNRFFAVRDLARLGLGRIAHEQFRFDDSRYYYYLVPRDSDRLAEALSEAATSRYEKKDYDGARELLDELKGLGIHHRYEDEAWILDAYVDLAQCKFKDADEKLLKFVALYEPVRDAARKISVDDRTMAALLSAARTGSDAGGTEAGATVNPDALRAIAALVRLDPAYGAIVRRRGVLEHEASGLRLTLGALGDTQRELATNGGVRPAIDDKPRVEEQNAEARAAIDGVRHAISDLEALGAGGAQLTPLKEELATLEARLHGAPTTTPSALGPDAVDTGGKDLPDLLRADSKMASSFGASIDEARRVLEANETALAKDAIHRVDLRLSRLLRRARLGRIESVLGRKRALEVEIEAINNGYLPQDALDSLDAARYLKDSEEYWPFEGDDWPDEFVGSEGLK